MHSPPPDEPVLLTPRETARRLSVGLARVKQLIADGDLEVVDLAPRTRRITTRSVASLIEARTRR